MHVSLATHDADYDANLAERLQTSSVDELKTVLAFFDCVQLRQRNAVLVERLREELTRRGISIP
jgi:hypothetical protein